MCKVVNKSPAVPEELLGDRYRIEHVIGNLVSNATKFSPEKSEIVIDISVEKRDKSKWGPTIPGIQLSCCCCCCCCCFFFAFSDLNGDKATIKVVVKDRGPGISAEDQAKLFKNFVQIRPGKLQKGGGSGLGLTIAKQIVELHGGEIGVKSAEGQGSQFYFSIPFQVLKGVDRLALE
jgi:two-component system sensor histidine kinase/response regulator